MKKISILISIFVYIFSSGQAQEKDKVKKVRIETTSTPTSSDISLTLIHRIQSYNAKSTNLNDVYDKSIHSPKSVVILDSKNKFYVHSLEGSSTSVYDLQSFKLLKVIHHVFTKKEQHLFLENTYFNYTFRTKTKDVNIFQGKPVESCLTHNGNYLWVTYYRRDYDTNAIDPSALAIIDTDTDEIVRVMPTGPLPKMIASSIDNKYVAVTHWGDNTVGIIDISGDNFTSFHYTKNIIIGYKKQLNYSNDKKINRDKNCGLCLRGTLFTSDSTYLLIGEMGGTGIAIIDLKKQSYIGSIQGMKNNIRHIILNNNNLYLSINKDGYVQKTDYLNLINFWREQGNKKSYTEWESVFVGKGARTITSTKDGSYIFAAVNNESKIVAVRTKDMKVVASIDADSFPVGMAIDSSNRYLIVTSQGKTHGGGNSVMIFAIKDKSIKLFP